MLTLLATLLLLLPSPSLSTLYTDSPGKCIGGLTPEATPTTHSTSNCKAVCDSDASCTAYNTKSSSDTWCQTYSSSLMWGATTGGYGSWTCYTKDDEDFETLGYGLCITGSNWVSYSDRNCKERCLADPKCTAITYGQMNPFNANEPLMSCRTHSTETVQLYTSLHFFACAKKRTMKYSIYIRTGSVGSDSGNLMGLVVYGSKGEVGAGLLARSGYDLPANSLTKYEWTLRDLGEINKLRIATASTSRYCPDYIEVISERDPIPIRFWKNSNDCISMGTARSYMDFRQTTYAK